MKKTKKIVELVMILDESGSMYGLEKDVIGGYNRLIDERKKDECETLVTTIMFSNQHRIVVDREPIGKVEALSGKDYRPNGCTALLDTIGDTVEHISRIHRYLPKELQPKQTILAITTDGQENSSHRYSYQQIRSLLEEKQAEGWEVLFMAANIDAEESAESIGIPKARAVNYGNTAEGYQRMMSGVSKAVSRLMKDENIGEDWKDEIN